VEQTASTNTCLLQLSGSSRLPEGTTVVARSQTDGHGQGENTWESEPDKNLTFSIVLYPTFVKGAEQFVISKVISLAVYDFVSQYADGVSVKWPNDVYVGDRKIAGILIENFIEGAYLTKTIAGIGLNINQERFVSDAPNPVSLCQVAGMQFDTDHCLKQTLQYIAARYLQLRGKETAALHGDYIRRMYRFGEWRKYRAGGEVFEARITGVNRHGMIRMLTADNEVKTFGFKEVAFEDGASRH
jgi:BirA family biotin operon repressor/biotin-[acetyl-CoA-carboxylase] ligase